MANRPAFFSVLLILAAAQIFLAIPIYTARITEPFWWPVLGLLPVWAGILWQRRRGSFTITLASHGLLALSALVLVAGLLRGSAWLGAVGLWLLAAAVGVSARDERGASAPLLYSVPWLLLAWLPGRWAASSWLWLMSQISRKLLVDAVDRGHLVWTEGTALLTRSGDCDPAVICNSPFAWGGLTAVAWLMILVRRRSLPQTFLIMVLSVVFQIISAAGIVWLCLRQLNSVGGTSEWAPTLAHAGLLFSGVLGLVLSDFFVTALMAPMHVGTDGGDGGINPLADFWNRWVSVLPPEELVKLPPQGFVAGLRQLFEVPLRSAISQTLWAWWDSRSLLRLAAGVPLLGLAITILLSVMGKSELAAINRAESRLEIATSAGQSQDQEEALRTLISLQPEFAALKLRLAALFWANGDRDACLEQLRPLTADGAASYAPACFWLVRNSLSPLPLVSLTDNDRVRHLLKVIDADPDNAEAFSLLAQSYLSLGEVSLAERAFVNAADKDPERNLQLLQFYRAIGRKIGDQARFETYLQKLQQLDLEKPGDVARTMEIVRLQLLLGRTKEALDNVISARSTIDSDELRRLEAEARLIRVRVNTGLAFLRMQEVIDDAQMAMQLAPGFMNPLKLSVKMKILEGAEFDLAVVRQVLDYWQRQDGTDDSVRLGQGLALFLAEDYAAAVDRLQNNSQLDTEERLTLISALQRSGQVDQAGAAAEAAVAALGPFQDLPRKRQAVLFHAAAGNPERGLVAVEENGETSENQQVRALVSLLQFDQLSGYPGDMSLAAVSWKAPATADVEKLLSLLKDALLRDTTQSAAARRLYRVRRSALVTEQDFDNWLFKVRAELASPERLLLVVGTMALNEEAWQDALYWLDAAVKAARVAPVTAMNNLALAIVRAGVRDRYPEALTLVTKAFQASPENPDLLASRGEVRMALGQWDVAKADLERSLVLQPENNDAIRLLPAVYEALGDQEAATAFRQKYADKKALK